MILLFTKHVDFRKQFIALKFNKNVLKRETMAQWQLNDQNLRLQESENSHRIDFPKTASIPMGPVSNRHIYQ